MSDVKASPNGAREDVFAPMHPLSGADLIETTPPKHAEPAAPAGPAAPVEFRKPYRAPDYRLRGLQIDQPEVVEVHEETPAPTPVRRRTQRRRAAKWLLVAVVVLLAATLARIFVAQSFYVPSAAMAPTIKAGDRVLVVKWGALSGPLRTGDIVVFRQPSDYNCSGASAPAQDLVKRVIALPGQTIWSVGKVIYVDGKPLHELGWYDARFGPVANLAVPRTTVPRGDYFVLGDNRWSTCDSRSFGAIPRSLVVGKVVAILFRGAQPFIQFF